MKSLAAEVQLFQFVGLGRTVAAHDLCRAAACGGT
jgi:hypothetical protein